MAIFGGAKSEGPTRLNRVQINQSVQGYPLPVVMGRGKVQQSLLWVDGFTSKKIAQGGKGLGGGKGGSSYVYSADVIAALCCGTITGVGDVWSGQSWLSNTNTTETYTITGGSPVYTPTNAAAMTEDHGVSLDVNYTSTHNDLNAPAPTSLSGTDSVPFLHKAFGIALQTGQYSINPATNEYHFSASDVGKTVKLNYSFALNIVKQSEQAVIPSGKDVGIGGNVSKDTGLSFYADCGVIYSTGVNQGKALTKTSGTPGTGQYTVTPGGTVLGVTFPAVYHFAAGDVNAQVQITYKMKNDGAVPKGTPSSLSFTVFEGYQGQAPWALLTSNFPEAALGYSGIAYVAYGPMSLGYGANIQQNVFEVQSADAYGGGIQDCSPVQCMTQVLTNPVWGLGAGKVPFPASIIDAVTWGSKTPGAVRQADATAFSWFAANGFFISPVLDRQETAGAVISKWLEAGACAMFMSEGLLKLVPYGDQSVAGNGATWTAPQNYVVALDDTCFIASEGEEPVKISTDEGWQDAYNTVQIGWNNRSNQYAPEITPDFDQAAIDRYGSRIEDPVNYEFITTLPAAKFAASMRVKRKVYVRNKFEFTLPFAYGYVEPMDVVEITTSSVWAAGLNNQNLAIVNRPVRVIKKVDNPDGTIDITAEDYPFGVHQPVLYNKDVAAGQTQPNMFEDPGNTEAIIFEAYDKLTGYKGNQIWIGATGGNERWGGCYVLASMDGDTYKQIGKIDERARLGVLAADLPAGAWPVTVQLVEDSAPLESATSADADAHNTLCYVDGEVIGYSNAALIAQDTYKLDGYVLRGLMGTAAASHTTGKLFLRLDDSIFKYTYDPVYAGKTIYLKFQSFNAFGNSLQDPSELTPVAFTIPGTNGGAVSASTGLIIAPQTSSSFLNGQGSIVPNQALPQPTWNLLPTQIVLNWSSQSMKLADGSTITVPAGTKTYTGLTAGQTYYIYPYVRVSDYTVQFANAAPPPTQADPVAGINTALDGRFPLNRITITLPTSGGSSGGGGVSCPESAELVEVSGKGVIPVGDVQVGDRIRGRSLKDGVDVYREVICKRVQSCAAWQMINHHRVSPCEPVYDGEKYLPAFKYPGAEFDGSVGLRVELTVAADSYDEANYWLVSGEPLLTHNNLPSNVDGGGS